ncbi:MAG: hypothetical protein LQ349_009294 [Xanthoria aureola]|nr:MAG: hypothetical protein LQ349_009294 [Xanthoria aureola]
MYNGALKRILDSEQDLHDYSGIAEMPYRRIYDEASLESFLDIWNWRVVSEALATAQKGESMAADGSHIFMARGGQAYFPKLPAGIKQSPGYPKQPPNILPGDTKLGSKWKSSNIEPGKVSKATNRDGWLAAIRQIYTYCVQTDARYGYLLTDKELVAVRISWIPDTEMKGPKDKADSGAHRIGILEYKAIPWSYDETETQSSDGRLTVNLALWWLHMMAAVGHEMQEYDKALDKAHDREPETPSDDEDQQSFDLRPSNTFQSETSDVRHVLSTTSLGQHGREASPTAAVNRRKRNREEQVDSGRDYTRSRRRVNPVRNGKI